MYIFACVRMRVRILHNRRTGYTGAETARSAGSDRGPLFSTSSLKIVGWEPHEQIMIKSYFWVIFVLSEAN